MTPQLRQAIKLLQFSNIEVAAFVEEELERNPLLERDERDDTAPAERPALDQGPVIQEGPRDVAEAAQADTIPAESAAPLDQAEYAETYDPGGASDGVRLGDGRGGSQGFDDDTRGIDDFAAATATLREHLGEQLRLTFHEPVDRMIGATLLALLGLEHTKLTFRYNGRDFRLTDVAGEVVREIIA